MRHSTVPAPRLHLVHSYHNHLVMISRLRRCHEFSLQAARTMCQSSCHPIPSPSFSRFSPIHQSALLQHTSQYSQQYFGAHKTSIRNDVALLSHARRNAMWHSLLNHYARHCAHTHSLPAPSCRKYTPYVEPPSTSTLSKPATNPTNTCERGHYPCFQSKETRL